MSVEKATHKGSIRFRVTLSALAVVTVVLAIAGFATVQIMAKALTDNVSALIEQDLESLSERLESNPGSLGKLAESDDGLLIRLSGESQMTNDDDAAKLPTLTEGESRRIVIDGEPYLASAEDTDAGPLTVARSLEHVDDAVQTTEILLWVGIPIVLVIFGLAIWVVIGRALAPVNRLRSQVDGISASDLSKRVNSGGGKELVSLAKTMNGMLDRIESAQRTQRQFVSDASHELRSPLATIRQYAEVASTHPSSMSLETLSEAVLGETKRMQELVEGLLLLARLDEGQTPAMEPVDLDDLVLREARRLKTIGKTVDVTDVAPTRVIGNQTLLERALRNLADNAVRHASTLIKIRLSKDGSLARLSVEDDGSGVPLADRERIFDRFNRLDEARSRDSGGSGLGLAIVREVAKVHGGSVSVDDGSLGGAQFTITLPAES